MKNYDPNITQGVHTVKVTLQIWDYVGHVTYKIGSRCKGRAILDFDFLDFETEDEFSENDCCLEYHEDGDYFSCTLKNENGDTLECKNDVEEMNDMIVALEILDYKKVED